MTQPAPTSGDPAPTTPPTPTPAPTGPTPPAPASPPAPAGQQPDEPLGPAGLKALQEEREARKALEKQIADLAPLRKLAEAIGAGTPAAGGKSEVDLLQERFDAYEKTVAEERQARWRAEVAAEKQLPPGLAARLQGATREELAADADALSALIPAAPPAGPRTPQPDPSQGPRGPVDIDARIRDAESKGNVREAIRLKQQKLHAK
jgi:hypothetical protein